MAKKALVNKQQRTPKFKVRGYTRCQRCGRPHAVYRKFLLCRICLRELGHAGEIPGRQRRPAGEGGDSMTMTDPIADMLTRIRNANMAMHDEVHMPSSKLKEALAALLVEGGLHRGLHRRPTTRVDRAASLTITMKYSPERKRVISGVKRVSKPGLRVYTKADKIPRVLGGLGVAVLSTSQGLMTDREARKRRMGGEILCFVW